jgi:glycosyltransferase involved in cell wall biosynthesis
MSDNRDVFVVIPTYNEGKVIRATLAPLLEAGYSVVVVDDGSRDDTWRLIQGLPVYKLRHPVNLGQGAALQTGMTFACRQGAHVVVHFDADGQHNAADIPRLVAPILAGEADVVLGSRFLRDEDRRGVPRARQVMLRGAVVVNFLATGLWLSDAHNGLRAFARGAAEQIELHENGFAHASEIIWQIRQSRLRYLERPMTVTYSEYSIAKGQSVWNAFNVLWDLVLRRLLP